MKKFLFLVMPAMGVVMAYSQNATNGSPSSQRNLLMATIENVDEEEKKLNKKRKKEETYITFFGGFVYSNILGETEGYTGGITGFLGGFQTGILPLSSSIYLDAGLQFTQQGAKYKTYQYTPGAGEGGEKELTKRMNYLNLPITARYQPNQEKGFYAEAGVQPGLLLSAKLKGASPNEDQKEYFNSFDFGLVAGAGYQFNEKMKAGIRVVPGITNINKSTEYSVVDKHLVVSANFHYNPFSSKKKD